MSYNSLIKKPMDEWTLADIRRVLLTTDGIGIKIKTKAFDRLMQMLGESETKDLTNKE